MFSLRAICGKKFNVKNNYITIWNEKVLSWYKGVIYIKPLSYFLQLFIWIFQTSQAYISSEVEFQNAVEILCKQDLGHIIEEWFLDTLQEDLRQKVGPQFWNYFSIQPSETDQLLEAVEYLHKVTMDYLPCIQRLESTTQIKRWRKSSTLFNTSSLTEAFILLMKSTLFSIFPRTFQEIVNKFYSDAFKVFHHTTTEPDQGIHVHVVFLVLNCLLAAYICHVYRCYYKLSLIISRRLIFLLEQKWEKQSHITQLNWERKLSISKIKGKFHKLAIKLDTFYLKILYFAIVQ